MLSLSRSIPASLIVSLHLPMPLVLFKGNLLRLHLPKANKSTLKINNQAPRSFITSFPCLN